MLSHNQNHVRENFANNYTSGRILIFFRTGTSAGVMTRSIQPYRYERGHEVVNGFGALVLQSPGIWWNLCDPHVILKRTK